ncbi:winged helix-turn-helix transcriptional regulator [Natrinema salifodinae]|uniref:Transcriptional regulator, HxlR family n=1 Tax=Natrinema salifodinae TaxID=1202768 RepID=A0A1I0Q8T5_9EURY|nr:helix-turn-helix domain-containing protein [Natrinema salifodinae]SEW23284.1 transcriptional regulator, HxlR family [Natrinema salifodinae]
MADENWQPIWHSLRDLLGAKWTGHVLRALYARRRGYGFNELKDEIDGLGAATLSRRLSELECHGLVDRTVRDTSPPTTNYRLTDRGELLADRLVALEDAVRVVDCDDATDCAGNRDDDCLIVAARCE